MTLLTKYIRKGAVLAFAGLAILSGSVKAATLTYNNDDLLLGIFSPTASNEVVVDLGSFASVTPGSIKVTLGNTLTAQFGAGWATRSDLFWGVFGSASGVAVGSDPANTLYATTPTGHADLKAFKASTQGGPASAINNLGTSVAINGATLNADGAVVHSASDSFGSFAANNPVGGNSFGFGSWANILGNFSSGVVGATLDLFRLVPNSSLTGTPVTEVSQVFIDAGGNVRIGTAAVPDVASTGFMLGGIVAIGMAAQALRRKKLLA